MQMYFSIVISMDTIVAFMMKVFRFSFPLQLKPYEGTVEI